MKKNLIAFTLLTLPFSQAMGMSKIIPEPGETQAEMNQAVYSAYKIIDKELNNICEEIKGKFDGQDDKDKKVELLEGAQKSWALYRHRDCEFILSNRVDAHPTLFFKCLADKAIQRTEELKEILNKKILNCEEYDLSCLGNNSGDL